MRGMWIRAWPVAQQQDIKAAPTAQLPFAAHDWNFHASQQFWVGREHSIAARLQMAGTISST